MIITFEPSLTTMRLMLPESVNFVIQGLLFPFKPLPKVVYLTFCVVVCPLEHF